MKKSRMPAFTRHHTRNQKRALPTPRNGLRLGVVAIVLAIATGGLVLRAINLQVVDRDFYQSQGNNRFLRTVPIAVSRGTIFDRNGMPVAVSTPMDSVWVNPQVLLQHSDQIPALARALGMDGDRLLNDLSERSQRKFLYLRRQLPPATVETVMDLGIPGVSSRREYRRFYPSGAIMSHVLGFTSIDGQGQEGLELSYNGWLSGKEGAKQVMRDGYGHVVETVEQVRAAKPGKDLTLSIDRRIQYLAWRELNATVEKLRADSAAMVVMDPTNGEVLAMVSLPDYNPNNLSSSTSMQRRNRAATDVFEPGSTAKAFTIAAALESGKWRPDTPVDTGNGTYRLGRHTIHDDHREGMLDVTGVITRSSNVGATKIALSLDRNAMYDVFRQFGFGSSTDSGYPGESTGLLPIGQQWREIRQATIGYGYGFNVTLLQLAQAYGAIANGGMMHPPSFVKGVHQPGVKVLDPQVARQMMGILETVVESPRGTAYNSARIANYSGAGKTGTSHQASAGGYERDIYNSLFAGMVPASNPRLVAAVVVRGAKGSYFGTMVAAPVFKKVMQGALRILDVNPDQADPEWVINDRQSDPTAVQAVLAGGEAP